MSDCPNTNKIRQFGLPASFPWETNSFPRYKLYATVDVIPVKSVVVRDRSFVNMQSLYMVTTYWYTIIEDQNIALETIYTIFDTTPSLDRHALIKTKRVKHVHKPTWLTDQIILAIHKRDKQGKMEEYK